MKRIIALFCLLCSAAAACAETTGTLTVVQFDPANSNLVYNGSSATNLPRLTVGGYVDASEYRTNGVPLVLGGGSSGVPQTPYTNNHNMAGYTVSNGNFVGNGSGLTNLTEKGFTNTIGTAAFTNTGFSLQAGSNMAMRSTAGVNYIDPVYPPICNVNMLDAQTVTGGVATVINLTNVLNDTHSGFNTTTKRYAFPSTHPGYYAINAQCRYTSPSWLNGNVGVVEVNPSMVTSTVVQANQVLTVAGIFVQAGPQIVKYTGGVHQVYAYVFPATSNNVLQATVPGNNMTIIYLRGL
ncbi:MAG: hypothetical protein WC736_15260 [Gallionella sp.]|jgi:hypothetical protein